MATKHVNLDNLTDNWVSINDTVDPMQHKAWASYRREILGCIFVPRNYTVPTEMPPKNQAEANIYAATLKDIRKSLGWSDARATKFLNDPKPWR